MIPVGTIKPALPNSSRMKEWYRLGWVLPWLVLAISLAATYLVWKSEQQNALHDLQLDFDFRVREADARIEQRMKAYEQILRGVKAFLSSSDKVNHEEFHEYIDSLNLKDNYPGARRIGFVKVVPESKQAGRSYGKGSDGTSIHQAVDHTQLVTSVVFFEPHLAASHFPLGTDMYADPVRRAAMEQSRDSGLAVNSGKILIPLGTDEDPLLQGGFVMFLPVYKVGASHGTLEERRANITGWVFASFRGIDLLSDVLGDISKEVDIEVHDGRIVDDTTMLYDPDVSGSGANPSAQFKSRNLITIANHEWTVVIRSLYGFETRADKTKAFFVIYVGLETSLLLSLLAWMIVRGRVRAMRAAEALNHELAERKRAEEGLRLAATVVKTVEEAVLVTDEYNNIIAVNPAFTEITGYSQEEVLGKNPRILSSGRQSKEFYKEMWATLLATGGWRGEIMDRRKSGEFYTEWLSIRLVRDENDRIVNHVAVFSDITERKASEERMQHLAHFDVLTDLPNRALFSDRLRQGLVQAKRDKTHLAVMFLDLDKFKPINDTLGHAVGDLLLKEVAKRLLDCVRESDTVSRIGGDEFVVLLPMVETGQDAIMVADKILHSLNQSFELAGKSLHISVSIGIVVYPDHGSDERTLTRNADIAMYYAKSSGRNNAKLFQPDMSTTGAYCALDEEKG